MVTQTRITKKRPDKNGSAKPPNGTHSYQTPSYWPLDIEAAYRRDPGPYTAVNAWVLLEEEPLELFNGWLVWQKMTNLEERRIAGVIQEILSLAARFVDFGQAYPDQAECEMLNGDILKPDVCLISNERFDKQVQPVEEGHEHVVLKGSPELVVEIRSPSNRRTKERRKRQTYFENGAVVIWDVDPRKHKIGVYEVETPDKAREYTEQDEISCERLLPGWKRQVRDLFAKNLSAEDIAGQAAVQWRAESKNEGREEGRVEGEWAALRSVLERQARRKYGETALPANLVVRLERYNISQLSELADTIATSLTLDEWLDSFPA